MRSEFKSTYESIAKVVLEALAPGSVLAGGPTTAAGRARTARTPTRDPKKRRAPTGRTPTGAEVDTGYKPQAKPITTGPGIPKPHTWEPTPPTTYTPQPKKPLPTGTTVPKPKTWAPRTERRGEERREGERRGERQKPLRYRDVIKHGLFKGAMQAGRFFKPDIAKTTGIHPLAGRGETERGRDPKTGKRVAGPEGPVSRARGEAWKGTSVFEPRDDPQLKLRRGFSIRKAWQRQRRRSQVDQGRARKADIQRAKEKTAGWLARAETTPRRSGDDRRRLDVGSPMGRRLGDLSPVSTAAQRIIQQRQKKKKPTQKTLSFRSPRPRQKEFSFESVAGNKLIYPNVRKQLNKLREQIRRNK